MKLTIITINYNNAAGLRQTIESVVSQKNRDFEYVVIDGGSTDGSVDVIKEYADKIDYWVSEPDGGIYNAMNKGTRAAHGDFCQYLNSGDWLYDENVVDKILPHLDDSIDIIGGLQMNAMSAPETLSLRRLLVTAIPHQAMFIIRSLLLNRPYREDYKIVSDWIFFFEAYLHDNIRYRKVNIYIDYYDTTGISSNLSPLKEERYKFINSTTFPPEILVPYIESIPEEVYEIYTHYKYSFKLKKLLTGIIQSIVKIYKCFKRI